MDGELKQLISDFNPRDSATVERLAERLAANPPAGANDLALAFGPLFQHRDYDLAAVFPALLAGLAQPSAAAAILDLANHLMREGRVSVHPAAERVRELITLLGGFVERLGRLEEQPL